MQPAKNHKRNQQGTHQSNLQLHFSKTSFSERVLAVVRNIPKGETLSYGDVAERAGSRNAARRVGTIMKGNHDPSVPCHRVIKSDGSIGGYNRGKDMKLQILKKEGVII